MAMVDKVGLLLPQLVALWHLSPLVFRAIWWCNLYQIVFYNVVDGAIEATKAQDHHHTIIPLVSHYHPTLITQSSHTLLTYKPIIIYTI